jgi:hypothetical protein
MTLTKVIGSEITIQIITFLTQLSIPIFVTFEMFVARIRYLFKSSATKDDTTSTILYSIRVIRVLLLLVVKSRVVYSTPNPFLLNRTKYLNLN